MGITEPISFNATSGIPSVCYTCVINQAVSACRLAHLDEQDTRSVLDALLVNITDSKVHSFTVQHLVRKVTDSIIKKIGASDNFDLYADIKSYSNTVALDFVKAKRSEAGTITGSLEKGIQYAAAGNIIDFGAKQHGSLDIKRELARLEEALFSRFDIAPFKRYLENARTVLYICDNSGEIVFDALLMEEIKRGYPQIVIHAAFREKPIINDATVADAEEAGITPYAHILSSGSIYPGTFLDETTDEFQKLYLNADLIIAKGQGNFETLLLQAPEKLFFILKIKCQHMAHIAGVKKDSIVLMQGGMV